jgi:hypothetical protein
MEHVLAIIAVVSLLVFTLGLNVFTFLFAIHKPWKSKGVGPYIFVVFILFTLVFDLVVLFQIVPGIQKYENIIAATVWPMAAATVWRLVIVTLVARHRERKQIKKNAE